MHESENNDAELIIQSKKDKEAFGILMDRYHEQIFRYVRRISGLDEESCKDLLQEIFIKAYFNLNGYDEQLKFSSWLYRIAHNHVIDNIRKISTRPKASSFDDIQISNLIKSDEDLEKKVADSDCAKIIKKSLNDLPFKYKEVLILRFVEDKTYEEIMDILKKSKGSVATLISRGKKLLKKNLQDLNKKCI